MSKEDSKYALEALKSAYKALETNAAFVDLNSKIEIMVSSHTIRAISSTDNVERIKALDMVAGIKEISDYIKRMLAD